MKRIFIFVITIVLIALVSVPLARYHLRVFRKAVREIPAEYKVQLVKWFPFSQENSLKEWEEKVFRGKVVYTIEKEKDLSYVRAHSDKAASALYYKIKIDAKKKHPIISWRWRAEKFPVKKSPESLETENEDDFAARVYVIFLARFFTNSKVLEYVWTEKLPAGMVGTSPYSKNIKLIVLRSGPSKDKEWSSEERDIVSDYMKVFGRSPEYDIGAVAFMTNAEHTGTSAEAMYDEIRLGYKEDAVSVKTEGGEK